MFFTHPRREVWVSQQKQRTGIREYKFKKYFNMEQNMFLVTRWWSRHTFPGRHVPILETQAVPQLVFQNVLHPPAVLPAEGRLRVALIGHHVRVVALLICGPIGWQFYTTNVRLPNFFGAGWACLNFQTEIQGTPDSVNGMILLLIYVASSFHNISLAPVSQDVLPNRK